MKRALAGVVALVACAAMVGCSSQSGATVAVVDGEVFTEAELDSAVKGLEASLIAFPDVTLGIDREAAVLSWWIGGDVLDQVLSQLGTTLTDEERSSLIVQGFGESTIVSAWWSDEDTAGIARGYLDIALINSMISEGSITLDQVSEHVAQVSVELNPRYGTWMPEELSASIYVDGRPGGVLAEGVVFALPGDENEG